MSRHSIEIKTLLQSKKLNSSISHADPSYKKYLTTQPSPRALKRTDSSSSLRKQPSCQMLVIEERYRKLEENYRAVLEQTKHKAVVFAKQKAELEKYQAQSIKDKKQIQRLRSMLGFIKKESFGVQVCQASMPRKNSDKDFCSTTTTSKADQSTDAGLRNTTDNWEVKDRKRSSQRNSRVKTPYKLLNNKSQTMICFRNPLRQSNIKSPNSKYKFVPTLSFN